MQLFKYGHYKGPPQRNTSGELSKWWPHICSAHLLSFMQPLDWNLDHESCTLAMLCLHTGVKKEVLEGTLPILVQYSYLLHFSVSMFLAPSVFVASAPGPLFILSFERAWYAKIRHLTSFWTSVGVSMETLPFTMTSFQSAYGQVVARCEYSSSETDGRIAS